MNAAERTELDILNARLDELQNRREAVPKGRVRWLRELDVEILRVEQQRDQLLFLSVWLVIGAVAAIAVLLSGP